MTGKGNETYLEKEIWERIIQESAKQKEKRGKIESNTDNRDSDCPKGDDTLREEERPEEGQ